MAEVRVIRVGCIPYGLSALVDEQPDSLVVWLLDSEWSKEMAELVEQVLVAACAVQENPVSVAQPDLHAV